MAQVISISNHKGGVGKTTSSINIGAGLALENKKVLLIDLDPQANLTQSLGVENAEKTIYGSLRDQYPLTPVIINENLHLIPSTLDLSGAEIELSAEAGREYILKELINEISSNYDYVIIDTPPSLGLLTINAFTASNQILIPLQAQYLALQGLSKLLEVIEKIQKRLNKELQIGGVFITQYDKRKILNRNVVETVEGYFDDKLFKTKIRDNIALAEAPTEGKHIFDYNPKSNGAEDYAKLIFEIINK